MERLENSTPRQLGYRMPAEWHRHSATLMHWPSNRETWPGDRLGRVEIVYLNILEHLSRYEPVVLIVDPMAIQRAEKKLKERRLESGHIHLIEQPINDVWARDCGPVFVHRKFNGSDYFAITDWGYNAWGEKYPPFDDDKRIPSFLSRKFGIPAYTPGMVLEGGSIEVNGEGLLLTTESVLLNPNRNPGLKKTDIERLLGDYLGVEKVIWLKKGLAGDDTDGHIDDLTRFLNKCTVLTTVSSDSQDINHEALAVNRELLGKVQDLQGNPLNIVELPLPKTKIEGTTVDGSEYVPASYANFYIANGAVLVPLYDKQTDREARNLFSQFFPERDIIGIECADLVWGQGSIHCITQPLYGLDTFLSV